MVLQWMEDGDPGASMAHVQRRVGMVSGYDTAPATHHLRHTAVTRVPARLLLHMCVQVCTQYTG